MKNRLGTFCMITGAALVLAALALFLWNLREDRQAGRAVEEILPQLIEAIETADEAEAEESGDLDGAEEAEIDGYSYIGYLSIPSLNLVLPVQGSWSYPQLKVSPCRYYGSVETGDLVIAAHNYARHFGNIKNLSAGDRIYFTDLDGIEYVYQVAELDTLAPENVEEMTAADYPLTLFTCTYGGKSRVTVRCVRMG